MDYIPLTETTFKLLQSFKESAPGTYKHCVTVSDFCESIASVLCLDSAMMRCAGLYHDIGKSINSECFGENQLGKDIHDDIDPMLSYHMITRHVGDGAIILVNEGSFRAEIIQILSQHHGNTVLRYFHDKALNGFYKDFDFRYPYAKPSTTEAAILMISDHIEAKARALFSAGKLGTHEEKMQMVELSVKFLTEDGQLDNLKIGALNKIKQTILKELDSIYHKRRPYEGDMDKE